MKVWVDPKETAAGAWGGVDDDSAAAAAAPSAPVIERAVSTRAPVQYTDGAYLTPTAERAEGGERSEYARVQFNCAVDRTGLVKLTARGYRWGGEESDRRFKSLFTREADPTDTVPFDTYEQWLRFQRGDVTGFEEGDEYIHFESTEGAVEEGRRRREWESLRWAVRIRLAELELVRNAPFARYRLQERGEWTAVRDTLRWKPTAFGDAER
jgi:hypothetical protein